MFLDASATFVNPNKSVVKLCHRSSIHLHLPQRLHLEMNIYSLKSEYLQTQKLTVADAAAVRMAQRVGVVSFLRMTGHLLTFTFSQ